MNTFKYRLVGVILMMLALLLVAAPALADTGAFLSELKGGAGVKRTVALCELTGDDEPEMVSVAFNGSEHGTLSLSGSRSTSYDLTQFELGNARSLSMQLRKGGSADLCLYVSASGLNGKVSSTLRLGLGLNQSGSFTPLFVARTVKSGGKTKYYIGGAQVSASAYSKAKKSFEKTYKKVGNLPLATLAKSDSASGIQTKFNNLVKRYKAFSTAKSVRLSKTKATLTVGKTLKLTAKTVPASAIHDAITWSSSNTAVATVDENGKITAVAAGSCKITAKTQSGKSKSCKLTTKGPKPSKVTLDRVVLTMVRGDTDTLLASVLPLGANPNVTWTTSNKKVVTVSKTGEIKAIGRGKATITATTSNKKKATCKVVVNQGPAVIVDISQHNYNTKMDWATIAKNVDLMILRCGVTRTDTAPIGIGKDDKFAYYAGKCKEYGIPFGVYFYGKSSDQAGVIAEAQKTYSVASPYKPLFYVYDAEESRLNKDLIETYIKTLKSLGARKTGYYIAHHLYSSYKLDTSLVDFIWLPRYGKNTGAVDQTPNYPCDLHQYTSLGRIAGFGGPVDISRLMGTKTLEWFIS